MKKFLIFALVLFSCSFISCNKSEQSTESSSADTTEVIVDSVQGDSAVEVSDTTISE